MTVPPGTPPPAQWGSGIPGIPSIWDGQAAPPLDATPTWTPQGPRHRPAGVRTAQRAVVGMVALGAVGLVLGGFVMSAAPTSVAVPAVPAVDVAVPAPDGVVPPPVAGDLPTTAVRLDTGGEPFGLPLGTAVEVHDARTAARLEVLPVDVSTGTGLAVGVTLTTRPDSPVPAVVPSLVLRTPDGREQAWTSASSAGGVPSLLEPGAQWVATFVFPAAPDGGVLVLRDGDALAGWVVPATG